MSVRLFFWSYEVFQRFSLELLNRLRQFLVFRFVVSVVRQILKCNLKFKRLEFFGLDHLSIKKK